MEYIFEFLFEGLKKFAGEIVGVVLLVVALRYIPGLRALFTRAKTLKEDDTAAEAQRQLELQRQEAERLKEELMRKDEALRHAEAQKADEVRRKDDMYALYAVTYTILKREIPITE